MTETRIVTWRFLLVTFLSLSFLTVSPRPAPAEDGAVYSRQELAQMLAPVALYPDALLSQVLMASTYPLEVIEAERWLRRNPGLQGDALDRALLERNWDPSVKALCHFPSILSLMSERISETTEIGDAFLAQETEVMDTIQELRSEAYARGNLASNERQKVIVERQTIVIEPVNPRVVYVPYYDPLYVYGSWRYPAYPPWYWTPPGVRVGVGLFYWPGIHFSFSYSSWSYFDWPRRVIHIDVHKRPKYVRHDRWVKSPGRWHHSPSHRRGVVYRDRSTAVKYGQAPDRYRNYRRPSPGFSGHRDDKVRAGRRDAERVRIERKADHRGSGRIEHRDERRKVERSPRVPERGHGDRQRIDRPRPKGERGMPGVERRGKDDDQGKRAIRENRGPQRSRDIERPSRAAIERPQQSGGDGRDNRFRPPPRDERRQTERPHQEHRRESSERRGGDGYRRGGDDFSGRR